MNNSIYRAAGYDFANLWMNVAKIVIALVFLYQNALNTQMGVSFFQDYYYVFHVPVSAESGESAVPGEVVTPDDPYISIEFKPLALGQPYDDFVVHVLSLKNHLGEELLAATLAPSEPCREDLPFCVGLSWEQLTGADKAILHRVSFNLLDLVGDETQLVSGDYTVHFGFKFFRKGRLLDRRGEDGEYARTLKFLRQEELRFGDVPVVQGRPFPLPRLISERLKQGGIWGGWDRYRPVRVLEGAAGGEWKNGSILGIDFNRNWVMPARTLAPGSTYEQRGHYFDQNNVQVDFTIGFSLLKNEPPRSTYLGPGESDIYFVRIFYEWNFFERDQGYYYFNLSRHIIDPDGTTDPIGGRPDVRVLRFSDLQPQGLPYQLRRDPLTGDWHLRVTGRIEDALREGTSQDLRVVASDDFQSQPMRIRIER